MGNGTLVVVWKEPIKTRSEAGRKVGNGQIM